jgi:hypothetical protein
VIDDDMRPGHSANEPPTSPAPGSRFGSTVTSSLRRQAERGGTTANPEASESRRHPAPQSHSP